MEPRRREEQANGNFFMFEQQFVNGIVVGSVYALFAFGFTITFGVQRILNLAYGANFMWGAFIGLFVVSIGMPLWLAFPVAVIGGGLIGILIDFVAFRPLRKRGASEFPAIVTSIGANLICVGLAQQVSNTQVLRYPFGTFPLVFFEFADVRLSLMQITILVSVIVILASLVFLLYRTQFGRQIRAVSQNSATAELLGVNSALVYVQTAFLAGGLAAASGVFIGIAFNSVHFLMGEPWLLKGFIVVVLGGLGSIYGAVLAGLLVGIVETLATAFISAEVSEILLFTTLFVILLLRPAGLFGQVGSVLPVVRR